MRLVAQVASWLYVISLFAFTYVVADMGSVARVGLVLLVPAWGLAIAASGRLRFPGTFGWLAIACMTWGLLSNLWSLDSETSMSESLRLVGIILGTAGLWDLTQTSEEARRLMMAVVVGGAVLCASFIAAHFLGITFQRISGRASALDWNPNYIGVVAGASSMISLYLMRAYNNMSRISRFVNSSMIFLGALAVVFGASRTSALAFAPAVLCWFYFLVRDRRRQKLGAALAIAGAIAVVVYSGATGQLARISTIFNGDRETLSMNGRMDIWQAGFAAAREHPVLGVGVGAYRTQMGRSAGATRSATGEVFDAHNSYLTILVELGFVGLLFFVGAVLAVLKELLAAWPDTIPLCVGFACWLIGAVAANWQYLQLTWILLLLFVIAARTVPRRISPQNLKTEPATVGATGIAGQ